MSQTPCPKQVAHAANWLRNARRIAQPAVCRRDGALVPAKSVTVPPEEIGELSDAAALSELGELGDQMRAVIPRRLITDGYFKALHSPEIRLASTAPAAPAEAVAA